MNAINLPWWPVQWEGPDRGLVFPDAPPLVFPRRDLVGVVSMLYAVRFILRKDSLFMQVLNYIIRRFKLSMPIQCGLL